MSRMHAKEPVITKPRPSLCLEDLPFLEGIEAMFKVRYSYPDTANTHHTHSS